MDIQVLSQAQERGSDRSMEEYLLMQLMEEDSPAPPLDDDVDRLSHVMRSLEAEIMRGAAATGPKDGEGLTGPPGDDSCMIEEMLMVDLDGYGGEPMGYWPEVPPVGGWYLYTEGGEVTILGYEVRDQQYYCVDQGCVEQVYSPLWE
jgi:hypothetical protein|nr:uncharacterized protein LOC127307509 [Lolium perenne]